VANKYIITIELTIEADDILEAIEDSNVLAYEIGGYLRTMTEVKE